ncbi:hypothetical protein QBC45DRAFT_318770, partial [Copromyces sp. CBS 386.78]
DISAARNYYNNIIIALFTINNYLTNLKRFFETLRIININFGPSKSFAKFPNVIILSHKIDLFNLNTMPERFNAIKRL